MFSITIYNKVQNYIFFLIFTSNPQYLTLFKTPTPCHPTPSLSIPNSSKNLSKYSYSSSPSENSDYSENDHELHE